MDGDMHSFGDTMLPIIADTFMNLAANLGGAKDKSEAGRFYLTQRISRAEADALYHGNWLGGKIVDMMADDMTREWREWSATKRDVQDIEATERRLDLKRKVKLCMQRALRDGGSAMLIGTGEDPTQEFRPQSIGKGGLLYVVPVSRWEISCGSLIYDPISPWFGHPSEYRMSSPDGKWLTIHPSRVVLFNVNGTGDILQTGEPWGASIFDRLRVPIRDLMAALAGVASMMAEAKVDIVKVPDLTLKVSDPKFREAVVARFTMANSIKSINNALLLDAKEEWDQKTQTWGGLPDILDRLMLICAGAADEPVTKLFGRSPAGLNATGESDLENHYNAIRSKQENILRPTLALLDDAIVRSSLGRVPRSLSYDWRSLWSSSDKEKSEVRLRHSQAVKALSDAKIFDPKSLATSAATSFDEDGFLPGLKAAKNPPDDDGTTPPDNEPSASEEPPTT